MGQDSLRDMRKSHCALDGVRADQMRPANRGAAMVFRGHVRYRHPTVAGSAGVALNEVGPIAGRSSVLGFGADGRLAA